MNQNSWLKNFKPQMIIFDLGEAIIVQAVCAYRVHWVRRKVATRKAGNDKLAIKLLGGL